MAKIKEDDDLDDLNFDDFGDFDDFGGFDDEEPETGKRSVFSRLKGGFVDGLKSSFFDANNHREVVRSALPKGYSRIYDAAEFTIDSADQLLGEASKGWNNEKNNMKRAMREVLPSFGTQVSSSKVGSRLKEWSDDYRQPNVREEIDPEKAFLSTELSDTFGGAGESGMSGTSPEDRRAAENQIEETAQRKLMEHATQTTSILADRTGMKQSGDMIRHLSGMHAILQRMNAYQDQITNQFQKKSLEIGYRQYFVQRKHLDISEQSLELNKSAYDKIIVNTSLPEAVKIHSSEMAHMILKEKMLGDVIQPASAKFNQIGRKILDKSKLRVQQFFKDIGANLGMMYDGAGQMLGEDSGIDITELGGDLAGSWAGGKAMKGLAGKASRFFGQNVKLARLGQAGSAALENNGRIFQSMLRNDTGFAPFEWLKGTGFLDEFMYRRDETIRKDASKMLDDQAMWDQKSRKALTEVIPGYLSQMNQKLDYANAMFRVGLPGAGGVEMPTKQLYNYSSGLFEAEDVIKERYKKKMYSLDANKEQAQNIRNAVGEMEQMGSLSREGKAALSAALHKTALAGTDFDYEGYRRGELTFSNDEKVNKEILALLEKYAFEDRIEGVDDDASRFQANYRRDANIARKAKLNTMIQQIASSAKIHSKELQIEAANTLGMNGLHDLGMVKQDGNSTVIDREALDSHVIQMSLDLEAGYSSTSVTDIEEDENTLTHGTNSKVKQFVTQLDKDTIRKKPPQAKMLKLQNLFKFFTEEVFKPPHDQMLGKVNLEASKKAEYLKAYHKCLKDYQADPDYNEIAVDEDLDHYFKERVRLIAGAMTKNKIYAPLRDFVSEPFELDKAAWKRTQDEVLRRLGEAGLDQSVIADLKRAVQNVGDVTTKTLSVRLSEVLGTQTYSDTANYIGALSDEGLKWLLKNLKDPSAPPTPPTNKLGIFDKAKVATIFARDNSRFGRAIASGMLSLDSVFNNDWKNIQANNQKQEEIRKKNEAADYDDLRSDTVVNRYGGKKNSHAIVTGDIHRIVGMDNLRGVGELSDDAQQKLTTLSLNDQRVYKEIQKKVAMGGQLSQFEVNQIKHMGLPIPTFEQEEQLKGLEYEEGDLTEQAKAAREIVKTFKGKKGARYAGIVAKFTSTGKVSQDDKKWIDNLGLPHPSVLDAKRKTVKKNESVADLSKMQFNLVGNATDQVANASSNAITRMADSAANLMDRFADWLKRDQEPETPTAEANPVPAAPTPAPEARTTPQINPDGSIEYQPSGADTSNPPPPDDPGTIHVNHRGGMAGRGQMLNRSLDLSNVFTGAPRFHKGGIAEGTLEIRFDPNSPGTMLASLPNGEVVKVVSDTIVNKLRRGKKPSNKDYKDAIAKARKEIARRYPKMFEDKKPEAAKPSVHDALKPDEVPAVLQRGEEVLTADDPRHRDNIKGYMQQAMSKGEGFFSDAVSRLTGGWIGADKVSSGIGKIKGLFSGSTSPLPEEAPKTEEVKPTAVEEQQLKTSEAIVESVQEMTQVVRSAAGMDKDADMTETNQFLAAILENTSVSNQLLQLIVEKDMSGAGEGFMSKAWKGTKNLFGKGKTRVMNLYQRIRSGVGDFFSSPLKLARRGFEIARDKAKDLWASKGEKLKAAKDYIVNKGGAIGQAIASGAGYLGDKAKDGAEWIAEQAKALKDKIPSLADIKKLGGIVVDKVFVPVKEFVAQKYEATAEWWKQFYPNFVLNFTEFWTSFLEKVKGIKPVQWAKDKFSAGKGWMKDKLGGVGNFVSRTWDTAKDIVTKPWETAKWVGRKIRTGLNMLRGFMSGGAWAAMKYRDVEGITDEVSGLRQVYLGIVDLQAIVMDRIKKPKNDWFDRDGDGKRDRSKGFIERAKGEGEEQHLDPDGNPITDKDKKGGLFSSIFGASMVGLAVKALIGGLVGEFMSNTFGFDLGLVGNTLAGMATVGAGVYGAKKLGGLAMSGIGKGAGALWNRARGRRGAGANASAGNPLTEMLGGQTAGCCCDCCGGGNGLDLPERDGKRKKKDRGRGRGGQRARGANGRTHHAPGRGAGLAANAGKYAGRLGGLAAVAAGGYGLYQLSKDEETTTQEKVKGGSEIVGGMGGGLAGAAAGAALGTAIFPGVGTVAGGLIGGVAGQYLGSGVGAAVGGGLAAAIPNSDAKQQAMMASIQEKSKTGEKLTGEEKQLLEDQAKKEPSLLVTLIKYSPIGLAWFAACGLMKLIGSVLGIVWDGVKWIASGAYKVASAALGLVGTAIGGVAGMIWNGTKFIVGTAASVVGGAAKLVWNGVAWVVGTTGKAIGATAGLIWDGTKWIAKTAWKAATLPFKAAGWIAGKVFDGVKAAVGAVGTVAGYVAKTAWKGVKAVGSAAWTVASAPVKAAGWVAKKTWQAAKSVGAGIGKAASFIKETFSGVSAVLAAGMAYTPVGAAIKAFKRLTSDKSPITRFRMAQYGFDLGDDKYSQPIISLEEDLLKSVKVGGGKPNMAPSRPFEEYLQMFGVDPKNEVDVKKWLIWFNYRFKPVFLSHASEWYKALKNTKLHEGDDKLGCEAAAEYLKNVHYKNAARAPYNHVNTPFAGDGKLLGVPEVNEAFNEAVKSAQSLPKRDLTQKEQNDKIAKEKDEKDTKDSNAIAKQGEEAEKKEEDQGSMWNRIKAGVKSVFDSSLIGLAGRAVSKVASYGASVVKDGWEVIKSAPGKLGDGISNVFARMTGKQKDWQMRVYTAFKTAGFSEQQARILTAEIGRENSYNPKYLFGGHADPHKGMNMGMLSWQGSRRDELVRFLNSAGALTKDGNITPTQEGLNAQARFILWELQNTHKKVGQQFLSDTEIDYAKGAYLIGKFYIKWRIDDPRYSRSGISNRDSFYNMLVKQLGKDVDAPSGGVMTAKSEAPTSSTSPDKTVGGSGGGGGAGSVDRTYAVTRPSGDTNVKDQGFFSRLGNSISKAASAGPLGLATTVAGAGMNVLNAAGKLWDETGNSVVTSAQEAYGTVKAWAGGDKSKASHELALAKSAVAGGINNPKELAMFLAQCAHETGGFKWLKELGKDSYFAKYNNRKDLGNGPNDGAKFKGRGYIQLTGRYNYTKFAKASGIDVINNPDLVEKDLNVAAKASLWWWMNNPRARKAGQAGDIIGASKAVNGGLNGIEDRKSKWAYYQQEVGSDVKAYIAKLEGKAGGKGGAVDAVKGAVSSAAGAIGNAASSAGHAISAAATGAVARGSGMIASGAAAITSAANSVASGASKAMGNVGIGKGEAPTAMALGGKSSTPWMTLAEKQVGVNEKDHPALIREYHQIGGKLKAGGETPWCASFVGWVLEKCGLKGTGSAAAISYAKYGQPIDKSKPIPYGAIMVIKFGTGNHVAFCAGDKGNRVSMLGGNQSSKKKGDQRNGGEVTISSIPRTNVHAVVYPSGYTPGAAKTTDANITPAASGIGNSAADVKAVGMGEGAGSVSPSANATGTTPQVTKPAVSKPRYDAMEQMNKINNGTSVAGAKVDPTASDPMGGATPIVKSAQPSVKDSGKVDLKAVKEAEAVQEGIAIKGKQTAQVTEQLQKAQADRMNKTVVDAQAETLNVMREQLSVQKQMAQTLIQIQRGVESMAKNGGLASLGGQDKKSTLPPRKPDAPEVAPVSMRI